MAWLLIDARDRGLIVSGAEHGHALFTREPANALRFAGQVAARTWMDKHLVSAFGELALMREPGERDTRRGVASHYGPRANP